MKQNTDSTNPIPQQKPAQRKVLHYKYVPRERAWKERFDIYRYQIRCALSDLKCSFKSWPGKMTRESVRCAADDPDLFGSMVTDPHPFVYQAECANQGVELNAR